jgi:hypothetical protein
VIERIIFSQAKLMRFHYFAGFTFCLKLDHPILAKCKIVTNISGNDEKAFAEQANSKIRMQNLSPAQSYEVSIFCHIQPLHKT